MNNSVKEKSRQGKSDLKIMDKSKDNIVLFHPYMPEKAKKSVNETLNTRWIGQGPKVDLFEKDSRHGVHTHTHTLKLEKEGLLFTDEIIADLFLI